jgi:uncharacterized protein involved in exopolysaccharide biosynthesis
MITTPTEPLPRTQDEISLLALGTVLLRFRRLILGLGAVGLLGGAALGLTATRQYSASAVFLPSESDRLGASGLALAASQFGIAVPGSGGTWSAPVYVEILQSHEVLTSIVADTFRFTAGADSTVTLVDLLDIEGATVEQRLERAVRRLRADHVSAREDRRLGSVRLGVTTPWPDISHQIAVRLIKHVIRFNHEIHTTQAAAERAFVEARSEDAERALLVAEGELQRFLQQNRSIANSPELTFQHDRLQRDVALKQQVYTTLVQSWEDAKIREVRNTPVITVLQQPAVPTLAEGRGTVRKGITGGLIGGVLAVTLALFSNGLAGARRSTHPDANEFFRTLEASVLRRRRRTRAPANGGGSTEYSTAGKDDDNVEK